jgi:hypothetical protein
MRSDDFSRANCISICCAARSSTAQPCDRNLNNFIGLVRGSDPMDPDFIVWMLGGKKE